MLCESIGGYSRYKHLRRGSQEAVIAHSKLVVETATAPRHVPGKPNWFGHVSVEDRVAVARAIFTGFTVADDVQVSRLDLADDARRGHDRVVRGAN